MYIILSARIFYQYCYKFLYEKYDMQTLIKYVYFIYQLYQKDDNPTPLGKLCDYVAENWENVENMSRSAVLNQFYNSLF